VNNLRWLMAFKAAWDDRTVIAYNDEDGLPYNDVNYADDNMWTEVHGSRVLFFFGSPYRKEVSIADEMGTFQKSAFELSSQGVIKRPPPDRWGHVQDHYYHCAYFSDVTINELIDKGLSLIELYPDPEDAVRYFLDEVCLQY
jgi:hypothetical protein